MADGLVAFLRARLDEDEKAAQAATSGRPPSGSWRARVRVEWLTARFPVGSMSSAADRAEGNRWDVVDANGIEVATPPRFLAEETERKSIAEHIARHDPARVLREVEAKRRIIDEHSSVDPCDAHDAELRSVPCDTLRLLALPYADHDEFREEWKP